MFQGAIVYERICSYELLMLNIHYVTTITVAKDDSGSSRDAQRLHAIWPVVEFYKPFCPENVSK